MESAVGSTANAESASSDARTTSPLPRRKSTSSARRSVRSAGRDVRSNTRQEVPSIVRNLQRAQVGAKSKGVQSGGVACANFHHGAALAIGAAGGDTDDFDRLLEQGVAHAAKRACTSGVEVRRGGPQGLRFCTPLVEPDGRVSRIRLPDWLSPHGMRMTSAEKAGSCLALRYSLRRKLLIFPGCQAHRQCPVTVASLASTPEVRPLPSAVVTRVTRSFAFTRRLPLPFGTMGLSDSRPIRRLPRRSPPVARRRSVGPLTLHRGPSARAREAKPPFVVITPAAGSGASVEG